MERATEPYRSNALGAGSRSNQRRWWTGLYGGCPTQFTGRCRYSPREPPHLAREQPPTAQQGLAFHPPKDLLGRRSGSASTFPHAAKQWCSHKGIAQSWSQTT